MHSETDSQNYKTSQRFTKLNYNRIRSKRMIWNIEFFIFESISEKENNFEQKLNTEQFRKKIKLIERNKQIKRFIINEKRR